MKKYSFLIILLLDFVSIISNAQNICGSTFNPQIVQKVNPDRYARYIQLEQFTANYVSSLSNNQIETGRLINPNSTITIPVVVHVLHNGEVVGVGTNISDAQIQSQIAVLNEDFRRLNADRVNTPAGFISAAADPNIEFRLACIDPNGNNTNGIHRVQAGVNSFDVQYNADNSVNEQATGIKFTALGGVNAWPTDRYLNIWVCNIAPDVNGQLLGYGQFPSDFIASPNTDGVVILNTAFGRVGNLRFQYDQGRTTTHEVGHWLNLFHIWGDETCGDDHCNDTPQQFDANRSNCPGFPHPSNCPNNGPNGDMFMNYMDYTFDDCKNIYTQDQTNRMRAVFAQGGPRAAFIDNYFHVNPQLTPICTTGQISATNPACLPITWTVVSGPAVIQSGQGTNTVTLQKTGDGVAIINAEAGGYIDEITLNMGLTNLNRLDIITSFCLAGRNVKVQVNPLSSDATYSWSVTPPATLSNYGNEPYTVVRSFSTPQTVTVTVQAQNACGTSTYSQDVYLAKCPESGLQSDFSFEISPNPARNSFELIINEGKPENEFLDQKGKFSVKFYDLSGTKAIKGWEFSKGQTKYKLDVSNVKKGNYILVVSDGKQQLSKPIIIE